MTTDQHLNTGAMALGSLPQDEAVDFLGHLETCSTCTAELTSFQETAAILGGSVAQTPPASLRRAVMEAVARTPQLPPVTDSVNELGRHRQATESTVISVPAQSAAVIPMRRQWYRRPQALLAAAAAVLVIGGGTTLVVTQQSSTPSSATGAACVAAALDRSVLTPNVGTGGDVAFSPTCDTAVVNMPDLPALPVGKTYQLWVLSGEKATSAGLVDRKADGSVTAIPAAVHTGATAVGVTVEPAGGSTAPTTTPIWIVPLTV